MSIRIGVDQLVRIRDIPRLLPPNSRGRRVSLATVYRWVTRDGLPTVRVGGTQFTSLEALQAWCESRSRRGHIHPAPALPVTRGAQRAASEAARVLGLDPSGPRQANCGREVHAPRAAR